MILEVSPAIGKRLEQLGSDAGLSGPQYAALLVEDALQHADTIDTTNAKDRAYVEAALAQVPPEDILNLERSHSFEEIRRIVKAAKTALQNA